MDAFLSVSGAQTTFQNIVSAMGRADWKLADALTAQLADSTGQGDFDAVYGAAYAVHRESE